MITCLMLAYIADHDFCVSLYYMYYSLAVYQISVGSI